MHFRHLGKALGYFCKTTLFPTACECCGNLPSPHILCNGCLRTMSAHYSPHVEYHPFGKELLRITSLYSYSGIAGQVIRNAKFSPNLELFKFVTHSALKHYSSLLNQRTYDVVIPAPSSRRNICKRLYEPAWEIAHALHSYTDVPIRTPIKRNYRSKAQVGLNQSKRALNAHSMLSLSRRSSCICDTARILLVDDVRTSGATLTTMAYLIRERYGKKCYIEALTLAYTPQFDNI